MTFAQFFESKQPVEVDIEVELKLYPNPTIDFVNIEVNNLEDGTFVLRNMIGKHLISGTLEGQTRTINMESYDRGIYILSVYNNKGVRIATKKVLKK